MQASFFVVLLAVFLYSHGPYRYGLYGHGPHSHGLYSIWAVMTQAITTQAITILKDGKKDNEEAMAI